VTSYLAFINNPFDMIRFKRIINEPKRSIGESTISVIDDICRDLRISPYDAMRNCEQYSPLAKRVTVLKNTASMFEQLISQVDVLPLDELLDLVLNKTGYLDYLKTFDNAESRIENVNELKTSVIQYMNTAENPTLNGFLEEIALYTEADSDDGTDDKVTLMTIHSAKGLEFDNVFVIGLEEGIFPSSRSVDDEEELEEERRLAYVAVTRTKNQLYIISAGKRMIFGQTQSNVTSRFIREMGMELINKKDNAAALKAAIADIENTEVQSLSLQQQLARNKRQISPAPASVSEKIVYKIGERVMHKIFGEGTVLSVAPVSNDAMLEIAFDKVGTKRIMANFAKITK
ncbi:MAG: ATP-binding domain-containing protein, partial [Ruminococcus sp.]|nr:ATP-binding domain-containing protein [Ruminococcus sp.]